MNPGTTTPMRPAAPDDFFDPGRAAELLRASGIDCDQAHPVYVRHKPGETTLVGYELHNSSGPARGHVVWCADTDRAATLLAKAESFKPRESTAGIAVGAVGDRAVFFGFPNDARLRRLRWFVSPRKIKRSLQPLADRGDRIRSKSTPTVLRYKPERRVVVQVDLSFEAADPQTVLLRYTTGRSAARLSEAAARLAQAGVATPAFRASLLDGRVSITEFIQGESLRAALAAGKAPESERVAAMIARMHSAEPVAAPGPSPSPADVAAMSRAKVAATLAGIAELEPTVAPQVRDLARSVEAFGFSTDRVGFVHGDLHLANVMIDHDRDAIAVIDLERSEHGPGEQDLGMLGAVALGHRIRGIGDSVDFVSEIVRHYRSATQMSERALRWYRAAGLIDQAALCARQFVRNETVHVARILDAARCELDPKGCP